MLDIEGGDEALIPKELSQDQLPYSFRFYDPIIAIIQDNVEDHGRDIHTMKNRLAYQVHRMTDLK